MSGDREMPRQRSATELIERVRELIANKPFDREAAFEFLSDLRAELFGWPPSYGDVSISPEDARLVAVLDSLDALIIDSPSDAAYPWMRAGILSAVGRHLEAAKDFLIAAQRFVEESREPNPQTGDEADWAQAALLRAGQSFVLGGEPLAAAVLLTRLTDDDRAKLVELLTARLGSD